MRRLLPLLCAGFLLAAREGRARPPSVLYVVGLNDTHGFLLAAEGSRPLGGADWLAGYLRALREEARARGGAVVVLDAGDLFQGTLVSNVFEGRSVVEVYAALGVSAAAVGNHEFDFGVAVLADRVREAPFPLLSANVFLAGSRTRPPWAVPSALLEVEGLRVGVIGLTTAETKTVTQPRNVEGLEFAPGAPLASALAADLRARGAQVVLVAAHMGRKDGEIQEVAEACRNKVDAIVSGHHHERIGPPPFVVAGIPIVQSGAHLRAFSVVELSLGPDGRVISFRVNPDGLPRPGGPTEIRHGAAWLGRRIEPDAAVGKILARYEEKVRVLRDRVVGETKIALRKGGRGDELGNLAADALRSGAGGGIGARYALQNAGGLRISRIPRGTVSYGQLFELSPFENREVVLDLTPRQIRDALETVAGHGKGFMRVSGLRYAIEARPSRGSIRAAPPGSLVRELVDAESGETLCRTARCDAQACESVCAEGTRPVAMSDFLAEGGDGLAFLRPLPRRQSEARVRDILVAYVAARSPLTASTVGGPPRILHRGARRRRSR